MGKVVDFEKEKEDFEKLKELIGEAEIDCKVDECGSKISFKATDTPTLITLLAEATIQILERAKEVNVDDYCNVLKEGYEQFKELK